MSSLIGTINLRVCCITLALAAVSNYTYSQLFRPTIFTDSSNNLISNKGPFTRYAYEYTLKKGKILDSFLFSQTSYNSQTQKIELVKYNDNKIASRTEYSYSGNSLEKVIEEKYYPFPIKIEHKIEYDKFGNPQLEKSISLRTKNSISYKYNYNDNGLLGSIYQADNKGDFYLIRKYEYDNKRLIKSQTYSQLGAEPSYTEFEWDADNQIQNAYEVKDEIKTLLGRTIYESGRIKSHMFPVTASLVDYNNPNNSFTHSSLVLENYNYNSDGSIRSIETIEEGKLKALRKFFYK